MHIVGHAQSLGELGQAILPGLYEAELQYLRTHEFARTATDILTRRTRLSLRFGRADTETLAHWLARG
jgi:glycerol-3-phosphate dehydrogenase